MLNTDMTSHATSFYYFSSFWGHPRGLSSSRAYESLAL